MMVKTRCVSRCGSIWRWLACALAVALTLVVAPLGSARAADEPGPNAVEISDGYVTWGIKYSWRKYAWSGQELTGGVEITDPVGDEIVGQYKWPIASGTYDPDTKTTVLNLDGAIHYKLYCDQDDPELCALDSLFRDLKVIISPEQQVIYGTYIGIPQSDPGGYKVRHEGNLAIINVSESKPVVENGRTLWSQIPTVAGANLDLYPEGTDIDPLTIEYSGPGGKPHIAEKWDNQGAPLYEKTATWSVANADELYFFPSADNKTIVGMHFPADNGYQQGPDDWDHTSFVALDAVTLEEIASTQFEHPRASDPKATPRRGAITWDQQNNTAFFILGGYKRPRTIFATSWDEASKSFDTVEVDEISLPPGLSLGYHGGIFSWDPKNERLLMSAQTYVRGAGVSNLEMWEYRKTDAGWVKSTHPLSLPTGDDAVPEDESRTSLSINTYAKLGCDTWIDEYLICPTGATYEDADRNDRPVPVTAIWQEADGSWKTRYLPNTVPTGYGAEVGDNQYAFRDAGLASDGSLMLGGAAATGVIYYVDDPLGDARITEFRTSRTNIANFIPIAISDPTYGHEIIVDAARDMALVMKDRELVTEFKIDTPAWGSPVFDMTTPGTFYHNHGRASDEPRTIERYEIAAMTASVVSDPVDQVVSLVDGAVSGEASFSVAFDGSGDEVVQWQSKPVGAEYFQDIEGATGASLVVDASLADDGTAYRAYISNRAGKVVTQQAVLSVRSAPRFLSQPVDTWAWKGDTATFSAPMDPDIPGTQVWQRLVDGQWVEVVSGEDVTVDGDTLSVVASEQTTGWTFRSVISNEVGSTVSDVVSVTAAEPLSGPVITQHPAAAQVNVGQSVMFTAHASGEPEPTVVWQQKIPGGEWKDIPGAVSGELVFDQAELAQSGVEFRAVFTNSEGQAISEAAMLTVIDPSPAPEPQPEPEPEPEPEPDPVPDPDGSWTGPGEEPAPDQPDEPGEVEPTDEPSVSADPQPGPDKPADPSPDQPSSKAPYGSDGKDMPHTGAQVWPLAVLAVLLISLGSIMAYRRRQG